MDTLAATASVLADASQPQLTSGGIILADGSCNTPAVGEDGTDGVALVLAILLPLPKRAQPLLLSKLH